MELLIHVIKEFEPALSRAAAKKGVSLASFAGMVVNTYGASLHRMEQGDMKAGYEDWGEINVRLSEDETDDGY